MRRSSARVTPAARSTASERRRPASGGLHAGGAQPWSANGQRQPVGVSLQGDGLARPVAEIQRSRLLAAAVGAIEEFGYVHATVAQITSRARISRRTFYELFDNREECLIALIENVVGLIECEIAAPRLGALPWRERVRGGLLAILAFFDREPALARLCVVQALQGGPAVLARREELLVRLARVLDEGRGEAARAGECSALTAEGLVGAGLGILHARLLQDEHRPLTDLLGELMGMIVLPYLGAAAARRELTRAPVSKSTLRHEPPVALTPAHLDPLRGLPMRLTYRTVRVLECIAEGPGVSNRAVAERAGISDQGQISKLLARLERLGLALNAGNSRLKGEPNAWKLTPLGAEVTQRLRVSAGAEQAA